MQGFNRYIPPDYDPKRNSTLNSYQGKKHALGARAKDIDKGILIVRFELPFNIWCGGCNAHIGAGVRYNAQKKKVDKYYSTPIYGFRCKCHLCDHWFEIRTDPKNAAYVVHDGARKKDEDWNPEENGGFAVHDTEAPSASLPPADPFQAIEKTVDQQAWATKGVTRLTQLTRQSDRLSSDPYLVSSALRRKFREEKKVAMEVQDKDEGIRERFGLHEDVDLGALDAEEMERIKNAWAAQRENRGLTVGSSTGLAAAVAAGSYPNATGVPTPRTIGKGKARATDEEAPALAQVLRKSTVKKYDPFALASGASPAATPVRLGLDGLKVKGKVKDGLISGMVVKSAATPKKEITAMKGSAGLAGGLLAGYGSD
ncbi:hypothetical protein IAU60_005170 [Kwoniella sp. DSM 27419]